VLWVVAVILMLSSAVYQRRTGPTRPVRGELAVAGETHRYRLKRNPYTTADARIAIPNPGHDVSGAVLWRRYPTSDEYTAVPLAVEGGELVAHLPAQPSAGKLEYYVVLDTPDGGVWLPGRDETVVLRYKDPVPIGILLAHIVFIFFALLIGLRAGLGAAFAPGNVRRLAWATLACMTLGGMILGPIVQKYTFGAFWTGFPFGYDLTDNKTLIMWLVWVVAVAVLGLKPKQDERAGRFAVVMAAIVAMVVYLIPHSLRGSELDYSQMDQAAPSAEVADTVTP
jgi:hypothetical protein